MGMNEDNKDLEYIINYFKEKNNEENISLIKEKLQNYECRNNILDNLINRSEELINESEKILNNSIDNTDKLINQIKKNETIIDNNLNNLDSLEKNINDTDLKIENTIKQKIETSSEKNKNKNTTPLITTESLYEEFKKSKLKEDTNSIKNNIYNQI